MPHNCILGPKSPDIGGTLSPKHSLFWHMDPQAHAHHTVRHLSSYIRGREELEQGFGGGGGGIIHIVYFWRDHKGMFAIIPTPIVPEQVPRATLQGGLGVGCFGFRVLGFLGLRVFAFEGFRAWGCLRV